MGSTLPVLSSRDLISPTDSEAVRRLFAAVVGMPMPRSKSGALRRSVLMPGPFWLLARVGPSVEEIHAYWRGDRQTGWPAWFERNQQALLEDPLRDGARLNTVCGALRTMDLDWRGYLPADWRGGADALLDESGIGPS